MEMTSPAFKAGEMIPVRYTCEGEDVSPALEIRAVPSGAKSLALIVDDPDAPEKTWVHWVVFNIDPSLGTIEEDSVPGTQAMNDFGRKDYGGPCPPSGIHRYFFKLYALDTVLDLPASSGKSELEAAMQGHVLAASELIGTYKKDEG